MNILIKYWDKLPETAKRIVIFNAVVIGLGLSGNLANSVLQNMTDSYNYNSEWMTPWQSFKDAYAISDNVKVRYSYQDDGPGLGDFDSGSGEFTQPRSKAKHTAAMGLHLIATGLACSQWRRKRR